MTASAVPDASRPPFAAGMPLRDPRATDAGLFAREVHCLLGLPFDAIDMAGALRRVREAAARREPLLLSTPNLNFAVTARTDREFLESVIDSDLCVADGMPVVWVARLLGAPVRERVSGAGIFERLAAPGGRPMKVYFFGGAEGVAARACQRLDERGGPLTGAGHDFPGFGSVADLSDEARIARINASGADLLVVSVSATKGQKWIARNRARLAVAVVTNMGAVVNFTAGTVSRAPRAVQESGLEWLWRIGQERSLWRRYAGDGATFLWLLATRVAPLAWLLRRHRPGDADVRAASIEEAESWRERVIRLRGAWVAQGLAPLRECLARVAPGAKPLRLDLSGVTHADTAFLGLLVLLHGFRRQAGLALSCGPLSPFIEGLLRYGCAEYLAGEPASGAARPLRAASGNPRSRP